VHTNPQRFLPSAVDAECAMHCFSAALYLAIGTLVLVDLSGKLFSLAEPYGAGESIFALSILVAVPLGLFGVVKAFIAMGVSVTLLLTYFPSKTSRLYAVDLASAALGCIVVVAALHFLDPISIVLLLAGMLAAVAWRFLGRDPSHASASFAARRSF
jgi:hypothetical protein